MFGKNKYRIVILPGVERIPLATYRKLEEFVRGGGILIATRRTPQLAPGLKATEAETNEVMELSRRLFKETGARATSSPMKSINLQTRSLPLCVPMFCLRRLSPTSVLCTAEHLMRKYTFSRTLQTFGKV